MPYFITSPYRLSKTKVGFGLALLLLVLGVLADNHDFTFSLYDLAFLADLLYGRFNLHVL